MSIETEEATVTLTLRLTPGQAAGLKRFAEKVTHAYAMGCLYPHRPRELRDAQAYEIMDGFRVLETALGEANVRGWPWVESGRAS